MVTFALAQFYVNFNHPGDRELARAVFHVNDPGQTQLGPYDIVIHVSCKYTKQRLVCLREARLHERLTLRVLVQVRELEERRRGILWLPYECAAATPRLPVTPGKSKAVETRISR